MAVQRHQLDENILEVSSNSSCRGVDGYQLFAPSQVKWAATKFKYEKRKLGMFLISRT